MPHVVNEGCSTLAASAGCVDAHHEWRSSPPNHAWQRHFCARHHGDSERAPTTARRVHQSRCNRCCVQAVDIPEVARLHVGGTCRMGCEWPRVTALVRRIVQQMTCTPTNDRTWQPHMLLFEVPACSISIVCALGMLSVLTGALGAPWHPEHPFDRVGPCGLRRLACFLAQLQTRGRRIATVAAWRP